MIVAILHNIRSIYNVGSIFRTADGAGVSRIYLTGFTPSPLDRLGKYRNDLAKVSLGAEQSVAWEKQKSAARVIRALRKEGYTIFAVEQSRKSIPYYKIRSIRMHSKFRIALIFGSETRGLSSSVLKRADKILEIPMFGNKESLNVSVAAGIVLYHFAV